MAEVRPFCGLRYNLEQVPELSSVISPPYDIISPEEQQLYYDRNPYNIIRLEFGESLLSDSIDDNRYTRAAKTLHKWLKEGILLHERQPAYYLFESKFMFRGRIKKRCELFARVRVEDWKKGNIRPHETTMEQYKSDRFQLLKSCQVNVSPVMGVIPHQNNDGLLAIFSDLTTPKPTISITDDHGVDYAMWEITHEADITRISSTLANKPIYIADGHHRYETALNYMKERSGESRDYSGNEDFNFVMMSLIDEADNGLLVLPYHRLVRNSSIKTQIRNKLLNIFCIKEIPSLATRGSSILNWLSILEENSKQGTAIGMYGLSESSLLLLIPRDRFVLEKRMPAHHTKAWKKLDVSLLHWIILREIMDLDPEVTDNGNLEYVRDATDATSRVDKGEYQYAFLLNPISFSSVMAVADAGDRMPPKSTYFYPKPPTGMIMNPLWSCME